MPRKKVNIVETEAVFSDIPVSYTHLDVYKRQDVAPFIRAVKTNFPDIRVIRPEAFTPIAF